MPIDKLSVVITLVLAFILHRRFTPKSLIGCLLIGAGLLMVCESDKRPPGGMLRTAAGCCQKVLLLTKGVCGLTAAHALSAGGGRRLRFVFSSPHMSPKKMNRIFFAPAGAKAAGSLKAGRRPAAFCLGAHVVSAFCA